MRYPRALFPLEERSNKIAMIKMTICSGHAYFSAEKLRDPASRPSRSGLATGPHTRLTPFPYPLADLLPDPKSNKIAIIKITICNVLQEPPHQFMTAEYQSIVYGAKINPRIGQRIVAKTPVNQAVKK